MHCCTYQIRPHAFSQQVAHGLNLRVLYPVSTPILPFTTTPPSGRPRHRVSLAKDTVLMAASYFQRSVSKDSRTQSYQRPAALNTLLLIHVVTTTGTAEEVPQFSPGGRVCSSQSSER
jgi:hypothetical protein